jgi:hypothetical protein
MPPATFLHDMTSLAAHCRAVEAAAPPGSVPDFSPVFHAIIDKANARNSSNCLWVELEATNNDGVRGPFNWRGQVYLAGGITPATQEGLASLNEGRAKHGIQLKTKVRDDEPKLVVGYYQESPKTLESDNLVIDASEPLPDVSDVGYVYRCLNTWFVVKVSTLKREGLITDSAIGAAANALVVGNAKIFPPMQTHIAQGRPNAGRELPNPLVRLRIKRDKASGVLTNVILYDEDKPYVDASGNSLFEIMQSDDGSPVTNNNIHEVVRSGSKATIIVRANSICCHSIGISVPTDVQICILKRPAAQAKASIGDLAGLIPGLSMVAAPVAAAPAAAAPVATAAPATAAPVATAVPVAITPAVAPQAVAITASSMDSLLSSVAT